jgi:MOSC domain-containing protein
VFIKELWRYPVKSLAGEQIAEAHLHELGIEGDRQILVRDGGGQVLTSRTHHFLLGLKGTLDSHAVAQISGHAWDSPEARRLVQRAAGSHAALFKSYGVDRFDVLPLLIATDGAIGHMGLDGRRLRPNIVVGGVEGLEERNWPGRRLRIGEAVINVVQLRRRCVMTTYDPDTLEQDLMVFKSIVSELGGMMALDCSVQTPGLLLENDIVELID